ncbi:MAG: glycine cleavage system aminomethyltransferase GcvT [Candidatus Eremiobacter antarcticus]|nr:glycine cleavage system aminomethyltransferase GcvT [Candidatus Eremiobacteraeota bacterium]MBC5807171.1 glycine cleavage system aminomethyltransferase GcvT [Candidatus Eremiobacteraeota bacterium]PZR61036.1 MAG: glycine cleavage system aminomethyltransferase GcvT [Candidatus Eremiobacter sp. RRmetagenome_bin22]
MSPFGGFLMPIVYSSILDEHRAVRTAAGMFDLSHMGQFVLSGDGVAGWLDELTVNEVATMKPNQARYNMFTNSRGGVHDDVILYQLPGHWLLVVNAGNTEKIWQLLTAALPPGISLFNRTLESALIAVQGPRAVEILKPLCDFDVATLRYYYAGQGTVGGIAAEVARTGYTGEDGFELFIQAGSAQALWDHLGEAGAGYGLLPAGLGARDVLRLEAGMPLYGHELSEDITPLMGGQQWAVRFDKPSFSGKEALERQRLGGAFDRIAGLVMDGKAPARAGYPVSFEGQIVGQIRSGAPAPALGGKNIATALLKRPAADVGTRLAVEIRGAQHMATVVPMPFYKRLRSGERS